MTDEAAIRDSIKESGLKLSYIAEKLGMTPKTLALKISGEYEFKQSEIRGLCELLNLTPEQRDAYFFAI